MTMCGDVELAMSRMCGMCGWIWQLGMYAEVYKGGMMLYLLHMAGRCQDELNVFGTMEQVIINGGAQPEV